MRKAALTIAAAGFGALAAAHAYAQGDALPVAPLAWDSAALDRMVQAIGQYQHQAAEHGWPALPGGPSSMRPDWVDPRVPLLRKRLAATGDLAPDAAARTGEAADPETIEAVARFQARHGMAVDRIAGRQTIEAMNVSAEARARQLMVNYDRLRRLARVLPTTVVLVNVPAATVQLVRDGRVVLASRAVVGRRGWPTPNLDSTIEAIEINPYWTVPPRIARDEVLPKIAADPGYLAAHAMRVIGPAGEVPPASVRWPAFASSGLRLRQDPGANNPLGALKFVFPNPHAIFLHDTPAKQLFARADRALSHGCIRIERAFDLALHLLEGDPEWSASALRAATDSVRNRRVTLRRLVPVRIVYVTAWAAPDGTTQFRPDIYGRDREGTDDGRGQAAAAAIACTPGVAPPA